MSLLFGADGDTVTHTGVPNATAVTMGGWFYLTDATARQSLCYYQGVGEYAIQWRADLAGDNFECFKTRATTPVLAYAAAASFAAYALTKWVFFAFRFDAASATAGVQQLLMGDLVTPAAEPSAYVTQDAGSGAANNTAGTVSFGNALNTTRELKGRIAVGFIVNRYLSLPEIWAMQYRPRKALSTELLCDYGFNGTTSVQDLSGNNRTGTLAGALTVAAHVPLGFRYGAAFGDQGNFTAPAATGKIPMVLFSNRAA